MSDTDDAASASSSSSVYVKSKKTAKRKRRATSPTRFGNQLEALLEADTTPLSLDRRHKLAKDELKLETKARKLLEGEKKEKQEKGHVEDVIGGWSNEDERPMRKVAQRGVVQLFNAIQQHQVASQQNEEEKKAARGSGKPSLPAPTIDTKHKRGQKADNALGRGKQVEEDDFLDVIRTGGVVRK